MPDLFGHFNLTGWVRDYLGTSSPLPSLGNFTQRLQVLVGGMSMAVGTDVVWARIKAELHAIVARDDLDNDLSALIAIIGAVLIAAGVIMVLPAAGLGIACIAGFSAVGPVAGTLAAWIQSTFYGAFTCGLFSIAQSVTMSASTWPVPLLLGGIAAFGLGYVLRYYVAPLFRDHPHQE